MNIQYELKMICENSDQVFRKNESLKIVHYLLSLKQRNAELEQRIKELEEPKMCITCKHFTQCDDDFNYCNVKSHLNGFINYTFGCIFHEPK